jgi:segregation and condensation protein A
VSKRETLVNVGPNLVRNLVIYLVPMILSLSVHEYAHAVVADKLGDDTPEREERLTLSPASHMDVWGTLIVPTLSIVLAGYAFIGWAKPVQVNPARFRRGITMKLGMVLTSAAGPLSNLLLAVLSIGVASLLVSRGILGPTQPSREAFYMLLKAMFFVNVGLCVFNFLPIPPLDGHRLLPRSMDTLVEQMTPYSFMLVSIILIARPLRHVLIDVPMFAIIGALERLFHFSFLALKARTRTHVTDTPEKPELDPNAYNVQLPQFEGPLDLLLHLIQKHELDVLDIPMKLITEKYLEYLDLMRLATIDLASEYLVMAAVLMHIKSKMLLPQVPANQEDGLTEEELDPREELVRRLLEYQKYKHAAAALLDRGTLGQDVFTRPPPPEDGKGSMPKEEAPLAPLPVFQLFDAFSKLLEKRKLKVDHEVTFDRLTITDRMNELVTMLATKKRVVFEEMFEGVANRFDLVITFLALLEMTKLRMTRLFQTDPASPLYVEYAVEEASESDVLAETAGDDVGSGSET